jgi:restriction system protein
MQRPSYKTFDSYDHVDSDCGEINFPCCIAANHCPICGGGFIDLQHRKSDTVLFGLNLCVRCGWWHLHQDHERLEITETDQAVEASPQPRRRVSARWWELHHAALNRIDLSDDALSIEAIRAHLARYWDQRTELTAQRAEDLVASVLHEHHGGEIVRLTANANAADGGVDLVLVSDGGLVRRAVQIKRRLTRDIEGVQEVRNFVGAMVLHGERRGTFVTTAGRFSRPARKLPANPHLLHSKLSLELLDGEQLLELLEHSALKGELALPAPMSLDQTWLAANGAGIGARELLLGDIRKLATLARPSGVRLDSLVDTVSWTNGPDTLEVLGTGGWEKIDLLDFLRSQKPRDRTMWKN